ncbi:MAG: biopolymer transporter ExbD [Planctomycetes bacterium]|nr:biopolymer transporter ExbD [Planctomycetota bacterium]
MAKKRVRPDPADCSAGAGFDMTPMIDVTFLLIIFFMCVTERADSSKAKLKLPVADKAEKDTPIPGRLLINVLKKGEVEIMGQRRSDAELEDVLELERQASVSDTGDEFPDRAILIRADEQTKYGDVQRVMGLCMKHKLWRIAFATKDPIMSQYERH